ncbi:MAG: hypothetical protein QOH52_760 [Pseudonocardiales bacterium]|nr:hypothetical protein [Pseudonocardiales bacterium]
MSENPGQARRRYRRRGTATQGPAAGGQVPAAPAKKPTVAARPAPKPPKATQPPADGTPRGTAETAAAAAADPARRRRPTRESSERGLRDLVGPGRSQLGVSGALRGRDVNRPADDDIAEAERDTIIVRRNWRPAGEK